MGRHKLWRKIAKRERRRKIRTMIAKDRDKLYSPHSEEYQSWLKELDNFDKQIQNEIEIQNSIENNKWLQAEKIAIEKWNKLQLKIKRDQEKKFQDQEKKRLEWENEQRKIKETEERLKQIEEEKKQIQLEFSNKLQQFLSGRCQSPPEELLVIRETKPLSDICPFFSKTACCRFGDDCSRNHRYCGVSKTIVATNFYSHFGLENAHYHEYDTDVMLEYDDSDTYKDYREFFYDVLPEFEKFGKVIQFKVSWFTHNGIDLYYSGSKLVKECFQQAIHLLKDGCEYSSNVCNNYEKHLRGNTYVMFEEMRSACSAYLALHARWYAGRQLSLQFCDIPSWKSAICGLQSNKRCPKGRACNFLHVFRNPGNRFNHFDLVERSQSRTPTSRSWRWSESPEVEIRRRKRSRDRSRSPNEKHSSRHKSLRSPKRNKRRR